MKFGVEEEFFLLSDGKPHEPPAGLFTDARGMPFSLSREPHQGVIEVISPILDLCDASRRPRLKEMEQG